MRRCTAKVLVIGGQVSADQPGSRDSQWASAPAWSRQQNQSSTYPRAFLEVAAERGVDRAQLLAQAGVEAARLDDPAARVSMVETMQIIETLLEVTNDPTLGFKAGLRLPLTAHGSLGYALMCAQTARQAIGILERFWHLRGRGVLMTVHESTRGHFFEVVPELAIATPLRDFMFSSLLTSMFQGIRFLMPRLQADAEIWLQGPEPRDFGQRRLHLPTVCFGMPRAGIALTGDLSELDHPLPTANPEALAQAIAQCERESALTDRGNDILRHMRAAMTLGIDGYPPPDHIAQRLHMTPRTLRRRLQEQGQSYQQLLEEARRRDACQLLADPDLPIRRISELLGYADPANFTRAFRGWTGVSPREWRREQQRRYQA